MVWLWSLTAALLTTPCDFRHYPHKQLRLTTQQAHHLVAAVVADTPWRQRQGLMQCQQLPTNFAMVFVFPHRHRPSFWMKNTPLALDLLFVDAQGKVMETMEQTTPMSVQPLRPKQACLWVVEMPAGSVKRLRLEIGTTVAWQP